MTPPARGALTAGGPTVTWLGHATAVADFGAARVVFDPLFRSRARAAGRVDAVLVTHSHVDHLNRWTLKAIDRAAHLVVPKGARDVVADLGFAKVTELSVGDQLELAGLEITAVPTRHDFGRWRKGGTPEAVGYVVTGSSAAASPGSDSTALQRATVHHAGDVDFSDHAVFDDIGKRHSIDAALLPIGGMLPVWYYRWRRQKLDRGVHIDPDAALDIFERLGAKTLVPVHWGTVNLRLGPPSMPRRRLEKVAAAREVKGVKVLAHGEQLGLVEELATTRRESEGSR